MHDDAVRTRDHLGRSAVDLVVADLPYGVQHGARQEGRPRARGPADLVAAALPAWASVLKGGGAMALAWNTRVMDRQHLERVLDGEGLEIVEASRDGRFEHRVDRSITRDLVVARKP